MSARKGLINVVGTVVGLQDGEQWTEMGKVPVKQFKLVPKGGDSDEWFPRMISSITDAESLGIKEGAQVSLFVKVMNKLTKDKEPYAVFLVQPVV